MIQYNEKAQLPMDEYRKILAIDRAKDNAVKFIDIRQRLTTTSIKIWDKPAVIQRYECLAAYIFKRSRSLPEFCITLIDEAKNWANKYCVDEMEMPSWWFPHIADYAAKSVLVGHDDNITIREILTTKSHLPIINVASREIKKANSIIKKVIFKYDDYMSDYFSDTDYRSRDDGVQYYI